MQLKKLRRLEWLTTCGAFGAPVAALVLLSAGCGASVDASASRSDSSTVTQSDARKAESADVAAEPVAAQPPALPTGSGEQAVGIAPSPAPIAATEPTAAVESAALPLERPAPERPAPPAAEKQPPPRRPAFEFANRKGRKSDLTFDDIKFAMEKTDPFQRSMLTEKIEALEGQTIRITGYMHPASVYQESGIRQFILVRDNQECCFGPGAALYDCIVVDMAPGKSTKFSDPPISVQGVFRIKPLIGPDGKHLAIYHLEGQSAGR